VKVPKQTFLRLVKEEQEVGAVFGPKEIALMTGVFDQVLFDLNLIKRDDPMVAMVAKLIIEHVRRGERDPNQIAQQVVGSYQPKAS
jgi:hypothetical protein